jgi:hypothetical protein
LHSTSDISSLISALFPHCGHFASITIIIATLGGISTFLSI